MTCSICHKIYKDHKVVSDMKGLAEQLGKISSVHTYDPEEYHETSRRLFDRIVEDLGHLANITPTVHRFLCHGCVFLQWLVRSTSHLGVSVSLLSKCGTRIGERLASGSREKQTESTTLKTLTIIC